MVLQISVIVTIFSASASRSRYNSIQWRKIVQESSDSTTFFCNFVYVCLFPGGVWSGLDKNVVIWTSHPWTICYWISNYKIVSLSKSEIVCTLVISGFAIGTQVKLKGPKSLIDNNLFMTALVILKIWVCRNILKTVLF